MSLEWFTNSGRYADRLVGLQTVWWKRVLPVQAPYRWHLRRLRPGYVLEIGCGLGRNLGHLDGHAVGVDHNRELVAVARSRGFDALTTEEFVESEFARAGAFDSLLASHVLEHMAPVEAMELLAAYLPYVRSGGRVIVFTPQERGFAADPTHVWFAALDGVRDLFRQLELTPACGYSFPLPRCFGRLFVYNEFVSIAVKE